MSESVQPRPIEINGAKYLWHYMTKTRVGGEADGETWYLVTPEGWDPKTAVWVSDCRGGHYVELLVRAEHREQIQRIINELESH